MMSKTLWLLWERADVIEEMDHLLGVYKTEALAKEAAERAIACKYKRTDGSTCTLHDRRRLDIDSVVVGKDLFPLYA